MADNHPAQTLQDRIDQLGEALMRIEHEVAVAKQALAGIKKSLGTEESEVS
jgi:hypothetical protein